MGFEKCAFCCNSHPFLDLSDPHANHTQEKKIKLRRGLLVQLRILFRGFFSQGISGRYIGFLGFTEETLVTLGRFLQKKTKKKNTNTKAKLGLTWYQIVCRAGRVSEEVGSPVGLGAKSTAKIAGNPKSQTVSK
ncbi:hypothetical protein AMECASPLE_033334 [Ameca splendens]|uniref:Uncharacterized protein n=1 Tax=Ameca splendens TaxID=208324 RepID=A0ABV1A3A7_9TELE